MAMFMDQILLEVLSLFTNVRKVIGICQHGVTNKILCLIKLIAFYS